MRFMIFMKGNQAYEEGAMPTDGELKAMAAYNQELIDAEILRDGDGLHPSSRGVRVTFENGESSEPTVTFGPFEHPQELVAGYWIWEVDSIEKAIAWAKKCPGGQAPFELEIRPYFEAEDFGAELSPELRQAEEEMRNQLTVPSKPELRALTEKINDAWINNDMDFLSTQLTDDVRWKMSDQPVVEGKQAFFASFENLPQVTTEEFQKDKLLIDGSTAVYTGTMRTRSDQGEIFSFAFCDIYEFRGQKVCQITSYMADFNTQS